MSRGLEFAGFVALAAAVHAAIWSAAPEGGGAGGAQGTETVTLAAAAPRLAALVATWERPVEAQDHAPPPPDLPEAEALPAALRAPEAPARPATPAPAPARPGAVPLPALPGIDRSTADAPTPVRPVAHPAPKPARPVPAQARQTARGSGQQQTGGSTGQSAPARLDAATRSSLMGQWGGAIRAQIERQKRYPAGTRAQGTVHLVLDVGGDGRLLGVVVSRSSGNPRLDAAALGAVRRARLPAKPDRLPGQQHRFTLPVTFSR
ncbi:MAG: TonB family protein [Roseovarius sp.]|jgi:protein TonB|nr:TonB family protein [Roseovarius sp.]